MFKGSMKGILWCMQVVVISALFFSLQAEEPSKAEAIAAANAGLPVMLNGVNKPEVLAQFNFSADEDISTCTLGEPFLLKTITPAALETYTKGTNIQTLLSDTKMYYFPVLYQGEIRLFMTVAQLNGEWKAVSIGIGPLAKRMNKVLASWSRKKGNDPILVHVFQTQDYFFIIPRGKSNNFTPIFPRKYGDDAQDPKVKIYRQFAGDKGCFDELDDADDVIEALVPVVEATKSNNKR